MNIQNINEIPEINSISNIFVQKNNTKSEAYYSFLKYFARTTQFLSWPVTSLYFNTFFKLKINGRENLNKFTSPFLIISNHVAFYDSFVFRQVLGVFTRQLPLRFMAVNNFNSWYLNFLSKLRITNIVYGLFGVFVVEKGRGIDKNLEKAVRIIDNGGSIVMFPEGSISTTGTIEPFRLGAASLMKKTGVTVMPVSMLIGKKGFRKDYIINIGEPLNVDIKLSIKEITDIFYSKVKELRDRV